MSARSTTTPSAWQMYCCFSRDLSVRCSMLKEIPELRAPENNRTGIEISPKVKCPDQTEAAIIPLVRETSTVLVIPTKPMDWRQPIHWRVEEPAVSRPEQWRTGIAA